METASISSSQRPASEMVGPFVLGLTLGRGQTSKVRLGIHKDTGFKAAIKIINKRLFKEDRKQRQRVEREVSILKLIDHPYVMKLYDVWETRRHLFIVLEFVDGGELFDYITSRGRLPRHDALRVAAQIVQGLEHCHTFSICHRDLKPENILIDSNNNIKIADFGMATVMKYGAQLSTSCGSPHYTSPEVVSGGSYDGKVSDVWSVGVILYALITAQLPFDHENTVSLLKIVRRGAFTIPSYVDADIVDLINRMLIVDPGKRIAMSEIKNHKCFQAPLLPSLKPPKSDSLTLHRRLFSTHSARLTRRSSATTSTADFDSMWERFAYFPASDAAHCDCLACLVGRSSLCSKKGLGNSSPDSTSGASSCTNGTVSVLRCGDEVDLTVLDDLYHLGWGSRQDLMAILSSEQPNLEQIFYHLLLKRKQSRVHALQALQMSGSHSTSPNPSSSGAHCQNVPFLPLPRSAYVGTIGACAPNATPATLATTIVDDHGAVPACGCISEVGERSSNVPTLNRDDVIAPSNATHLSSPAQYRPLPSVSAADTLTVLLERPKIRSADIQKAVPAVHVSALALLPTSSAAEYRSTGGLAPTSSSSLASTASVTSSSSVGKLPEWNTLPPTTNGEVYAHGAHAHGHNPLGSARSTAPARMPIGDKVNPNPNPNPLYAQSSPLHAFSPSEKETDAAFQALLFSPHRRFSQQRRLLQTCSRSADPCAVGESSQPVSSQSGLTLTIDHDDRHWAPSHSPPLNLSETTEHEPQSNVGVPLQHQFAALSVLTYASASPSASDNSSLPPTAVGTLSRMPPPSALELQAATAATPVVCAVVAHANGGPSDQKQRTASISSRPQLKLPRETESQCLPPPVVDVISPSRSPSSFSSSPKSLAAEQLSFAHTTTPRFHRPVQPPPFPSSSVELNNPGSACISAKNTPSTPSMKRSWFASLFHLAPDYSRPSHTQRGSRGSVFSLSTAALAPSASSASADSAEAAAARKSRSSSSLSNDADREQGVHVISSSPAAGRSRSPTRSPDPILPRSLPAVMPIV